MKDKIFNALKTEYKNLGFSDKALQGHAESLAATGLITDENLDAVVKGQKQALTAFQSEIDSRVTTAVEKAKKEVKPAKGADDEPGKPEPPAGETPEQKAIRELQQKLAKMEAEKTNGSLIEKAKASMKAKGIPDYDINLALLNKSFTTEDEVETFSTAAESTFKANAQAQADAGLETNIKPLGTPQAKEKEVEKQMEDWAGRGKPAAGDTTKK